MFEGSEKKIEVIFSSNRDSLLEKSDKFWRKIVQTCKADIISSLKFSKVHSYLLSESSLFVWSHRLVFITCGKTILSNSFIEILKRFSIKDIELCFFQRKNEFFPKNQKSCFYADLKKIRKKIKGFSFRFG
ncbi:MAG: adenosylmethionine decarboxylase, partial [Bdellovibrionaceae bacterium]|nr:adenosylmethionine decarboxylase [Pseudobdellovibrionaceae bacterium]